MVSLNTLLAEAAAEDRATAKALADSYTMFIDRLNVLEACLGELDTATSNHKWEPELYPLTESEAELIVSELKDSYRDCIKANPQHKFKTHSNYLSAMSDYIDLAVEFFEWRVEDGCTLASDMWDFRYRLATMYALDCLNSCRTHAQMERDENLNAAAAS